ncbi:unnamed protein product [Adineta steineri]|uniref:Uncharacterized protein n=1 Tax=Adineta steineri TaxID=433720 RepID=A0A815FBA7_9BILA|nr:unnamed protein product [Adineta steineri]CAF1386495.1 unnamed protein product [Adineta steineri]
MTALRVFPFIGAFVAVAAVVLAIIGVSTTYWFSAGVVHSGLWQNCAANGCFRSEGGKAAAMAVTALIAMVIAAILAVFSGLARNKSDASNNMARLCGIISVVLLFSSGVLIAASLYAAIGLKFATGYSFTLMAIAQFLSFLGAMLVAHWMGHSFTVIS